MDLIETISKEGQTPFYIYGAQVVAFGAYTAVKHLTGRLPQYFLVSSHDNNPDVIDGIEVKLPEEAEQGRLVVVAVTELLQEEIFRNLQEKGFNNIFLLTQHEEHSLMSGYFRSIGKFPLVTANHNNPGFSDALVIYEVRNHRDKPLKNPPVLQIFEKPIQAGAAFADSKVAELGDDTGVNISDKNAQYCEMTAVYWVWKNTSHKWIGIEHYRRHLIIEPEMFNKNVDVIMPLPYICYPHTMMQFQRFVDSEVKEALFEVLKELHPDEYADYCTILHGPYQYTYNLLCARREVFDDYCKWFFEITQRLETLSGDVIALGTTRALSYVAEVLTNLYFMHNKNQWNILHTEKRIFT